MPHAVLTSPSMEYFDTGIPAPLIPPKRVYRPLAATFMMEIERRETISGVSSYSNFPASVSRYIRSISSTVESFASDLCDDPAIKSVLSCRTRNAHVPVAAATQGSSGVSLRRAVETGSRASPCNPGQASRSRCEHDCYESLNQTPDCNIQGPYRSGGIISISSPLQSSSSTLVEIHQEPSSQMAQQATIILTSMATNSIRAGSQETGPTTEPCIGQKRKAASTDVDDETSSSDKEKKRFKPSQGEDAETGKDFSHSSFDAMSSLERPTTHNTRPICDDAGDCLLKDTAESPRNDSNFACEERLNIGVDAEWELLERHENQSAQSKSPTISNLMQLAHAASLSKDIHFPRSYFIKSNGVDVAAKIS